MNEKILCVDDEPNVLEGYQRNLRKQFCIEVASGGEQGLTMIASQGPYAVVVSDLRMPGMDGIQFLTQVKERSPDTVRLMLTGQADMNAAVAAVNEGNIFRFLTKPCQSDTLAKVLEASVAQHRLIIAERELLEKTLSGSIKLLTEILSLVNPVAFSRASRIRRYVRHMATKLNVPKIWQFDLASMLSQIGCITVPPDTLDKIYSGRALTNDEKEMFASHPVVGRNLLANIPRLEPVAHMIERQQETYVRIKSALGHTQEDLITLGAQMLKIAIDFDQLITRGIAYKTALDQMRAQDKYNPDLLELLDKAFMSDVEKVVRVVRIHELDTLMIADEDVRAKNGLLLLSKGQDITYPVIERLRRFAQKIGVVEPFRVLTLTQEGSKEETEENSQKEILI